MYFFSEVNRRGNHAGTKARNDVEEILRETGCLAVNSKKLVLESDSKDERIISNIASRLDFISYFLDLIKLKNQIVFVQYPMLAFDQDEKYLKAMAKKNKIVFIIHDVHGLRRQDQNAIEREIRLLNLGSAVVVHNRFMEKKLIECGLKVEKVYRLDLFDYLCDKECVGKLDSERCSVIFAGNFEKSKFVEQLLDANVDVKFNFFGSKYNDALNKNSNVNYWGSFLPDEIPGKLVGRYGLIWDGDGTNGCSGLWGEYTKYNNPHKLSLYIASGFPVIVWEQAAIAEFVKENHIGIAVKSLENLSRILLDISDDKYEIMSENVQKLRAGIVSGERLKGIIKLVERTM